MKTALIVLASIAVVLGVIAYFVVFSGPQVVEPVAGVPNPTSISTSTMMAASSSAPSSTFEGASSTAFVSPMATATFQTVFAAPYPVMWNEGQTQFAITGASLTGDNFTLIVNVQIGSSTDCIPVDLRLVIDEQGDMEAPATPASPNFLLGSDSDCAPAADTMYQNQPVTFTVDPTAAPYLFTTGDASNIYFEVSTTTNNGLNITVPQQSG